MLAHSPAGETLHRLLHAYKRAMREGYAAADIALTIGEIRVLKGIAHHRHGTAQHIADRMRQDKGRIARLIKRLVADGLVVRQPHPDDSRSQLLELTEPGQELADRIAAIEARAGARMAGGLSAADLARFTELAEAMIANLEHSQGQRFMNRRPPPRTFTVLDKTEITPNMLRVTLGGEAHGRFPGRSAERLRQAAFRPGPQRPPATAHLHHPLAARGFGRHRFRAPRRWRPGRALGRGRPAGETIDIGGPGPKKLVDPAADWGLLIGDMTALPAISVNLETLPRDTRGHAIIEVLHEDDIQPLDAPEGIDMRWVINPHPGERGNTLYDAVRELAWQPGEPSVWCACEFSCMRQLRAHLHDERGVTRQQLYISSYWQRGSNEDTHKQNKCADSEADQGG